MTRDEAGYDARRRSSSADGGSGTVTTPNATYSFTKLVVADLDGMLAYYGAVYGMHEVGRFKADVAGHPIEEIMLGRDGRMGGLILFRYLDRNAPSNGEVLLGFTTDDLPALFERGVAAGGSVWVEVHDPDVPGVLRVGFLADPEGHVAEVIEPSAPRG
jgi:predicted enzyme related to lactoylglutathione lyase